MNIETLNNNIIAALKAKENVRLGVLKMFLNEINKIAKADKNRPTDDSDIITAGNRMIKQIKETQSFLAEDDKRFDILSNEISIISEFLPQKLTEAETSEIIDRILADPKIPQGKAARGFIMKLLNAEYKGMIDNAVVNSILSARNI